MDFVEVVPTLLTAKIFEEKLPATYRSKWQSCRSMADMEGMAAWRRGVAAAGEAAAARGGGGGAQLARFNVFH